MNFLNVIASAAQRRLRLAKETLPLAELEKRAETVPSRPGFKEAFLAPGIHIIAELKKASPSRGVIRADFRVAELARTLENSGAAALSVLTECEFFLGGNENLQCAAANSRLPILRKDFILEEYSILEAKVLGASAVLLIAALLDKAKLKRLVSFAHQCSLSVLGEAHSESELAVVLDSGADLIGINARDLTTFHTSLANAELLLRKVPAGCLAVAESAVRSKEDAERLTAAGARGLLVGELLMRSENPGETLKGLLS